jgi:U3 small nucleolar RNA-associated protein 18
VQIDGKKNRKVQGVVFKDTPIVKAWFTPDGREAIVTGRKPWIYVYDVVTGKVSKAWYPAGTYPPHTHRTRTRTTARAHNTHRER